MIKWILRLERRAILKSKIACWEMQYDKLMNLCRDTGGENSPYFEKLQEHLANRPSDVIN